MGQAQKTAQGKRDGFLRLGLGGGCNHCGGPLRGSGRGSPQRFCQQRCRLAFLAEARRVGEQTLRRRRGRSAGRLNLDAMSVPERRLAFAEAALCSLRTVAADPGAELARLEALSPDRVELDVPQEEYEAIREAVLKRLEPIREDRRCA